MIWKDRIKQYPHRYTLTNVSGSTYDFAEVTGEVTEAGTPINAENMNQLLQRDGDDIKDTITTFSEAATEANILSTESTSTLFGKIKKWYTNKIGTLKSFAYNPATYITSTDTDGTIINNSDNQNISGNKKFIDTVFADSIKGRNLFNATLENGSIYSSTGLNANATNQLRTVDYINVEPNKIYNFAFDSATGAPQYYVFYYTATGTYISFNGWILSGNTFTTPASCYKVRFAFKVGETAVTTSDVSNLQVALGTATPYTPYIGEFFPTYDKVIRTQAEFEALIASSNWLGAVSVAFIGQFTLSTANNSGVKIPQTVKQIHGYNGAKITITNYLYNETTAKGGLWYDTAPTTQDYSIRDLEVSCTGTGTYCYGFFSCNNLSNCIGTGTGSFCRGFHSCNNLSNCTGTGTGTNDGRGFFNINYATNCKDGGSTTAMWGGTNKNISVETCRKTAVTADNATLNA